jgi:hypothetical protein
VSDAERRDELESREPGLRFRSLKRRAGHGVFQDDGTAPGVAGSLWNKTVGVFPPSNRNPRHSVAKKADSIWESKPANEDYAAAHAYLTLLFGEAETRKIVHRLRRAPTILREGKDLLRASQTHLLDEDDPHVAADLKKINKGKKLSPVLLVRGDGRHGVTLTIADGQHRICAGWHWDENAPVACCIASMFGR